ncbi:MAG TPA: peptidoglycan-binding protein [Nocardioidaceae bacterium]|nr:peptidoglycan-binding protein [Nocardioidaceae bacterium]
MRRRNLLLVLVGAVIAASLVTWVGVTQIRSPAEVAARTAPPAPSPILVPVVERVLSTRIVTRGTAHFGSPQKVVVTPSLLKSGPAVVTSLLGRRTVSSGDVLATVSGRPVFVLVGDLPSYRDLGPGMSGPDVRQLERSLRRLRLSPGRVDGRYDGSTAAAVTRLYRTHGFSPLVADETTLTRARPDQAAIVEGAFAEPGVQLPSDEVVFVPTSPLRVTSLPVPVGSPLDGPLATVTGSRVEVDGFVRVEQAALVREGAEVLVDEPSLEIDTTGRVASVAGRPGTDGADGFHVAFQVAVDGKSPPALVGASVRLTIPIKSTRTAQLTVPVTAVSLGPDGGSRVEKWVRGQVEFVSVRTGFSADGMVAVTPTSGSLSEGDKVLVGFERRRGRG